MSTYNQDICMLFIDNKQVYGLMYDYMGIIREELWRAIEKL